MIPRHRWTRWYAEQLADGLIEAECVGDPADTPPCRLPRASESDPD